MKLVGISGTIVGSKTVVVVNKVLEEINKLDSSIETELLDLKQVQLQFCDGRDPSTYTDDTKRVIDTVASADLLIIGTPVFQGSITGVLKNLFDLLPVDVLRHKVVGLIATGGTYQHYLIIENQLKPIIGYFRAYVAPGYVYAHSDHFNEHNEISDLEVLRRIELLAEEMVLMQGLRSGGLVIK
ncbi:MULTISPECIES: NAD(P)H-dependent oxidoreductase [unclassified Paenibacillus]|uniref:NADPH-dependent FMN reductase n=1 Tax=unclassified Paenibacillus TaxID=185978 RepID=UPI001AE14D0B|nr:FMN reductase/FAD reductase [NAD(P)H] [Paenibacillus sp. PvP091]MBP1169260.1 FMN reductase/FAD reductase [NAD(P)H] [Paenibacillus sp. PvR098]MBP2440287.1 FMN reductase/FAD reductase [NAD(P)H] [Paenibacillus sp. PvP052]